MKGIPRSLWRGASAEEPRLRVAPLLKYCSSDLSQSITSAFDGIAGFLGRVYQVMA